MPAPFTSTMDPSVGQYYTPNAGTYGGQNPNPYPTQTSQSNPLGWGQANTYAPWATPNGVTGQNPSFSQYGNPSYTMGNPTGSATAYGALGGGLAGGLLDGAAMGTVLGPLGTLVGGAAGGLAGLFGRLFGSNKKRSSPDFYAPSYQGQLFQPSLGYGSTYGMSQEGQNASMQQSMQQPAGSPAPSGQGQPSPSTSGSFGAGPAYAGVNGLGSNQSYVGQSPYSVPGGTYTPGQGGQSYGGYSSYGGYGSSGAGTQPYIPGQ